MHIMLRLDGIMDVTLFSRYPTSLRAKVERVLKTVDCYWGTV